MERAKKNPQEFVQADVDFHLAISQAASSGILMNALQLIRNLLQQWILSAVAIKGVPEKACAQHKRVLHAIENRDGAAARKEMRNHLLDMAGFVPKKKKARNRELVSDLKQLGNSSDLNPFDNKDITGVIEAGAMRCNELSRDKLVPRQCPRVPPVARRIVSQMLDDPVVAIHNRDPRRKIRHHHIAILRVTEMARHGSPFHKIDVLAVESKSLDPAISPVSDDKNGLSTAASIHADAVRTTELAGLISRAAKRPHVLAVGAVLVDVAGAISIAHVDVSVRGDGEIGWAILGLLPVCARLIGIRLVGIANAPNLFSFER
jgi:hypothetical protein